VLMNRYATLEGGSQELTQGNDDLSMRLDRVRDECARVQTKLQNEHLAISSQLHKCQVELEQHLQESQDATDVKFAPVRGDKSDVRLEEMFKQIIERVEDLQVELPMSGRLFTRHLLVTFNSEMHSTVQLGREKPKEGLLSVACNFIRHTDRMQALFDERGFMERVKFLYQRSEDDVRRRPQGVTLGFSFVFVVKNLVI
ncbi:unnamed protein product, partial [Symbiodinium necroappetens]